VEVEPENERAWLWLSGVVESPEERRLCLENVLALNPDNSLAHKGLARLSRQESNLSVETREAVSLSPPHGVREETVERAPSKGTGAQGQQVEVKSGNAEDVWATDEDICAYCAKLLPEKASVCPGCRRKVFQKKYRYRSTAALHFFWVVVVGLSVMLIFQALIQLRLVQSVEMAVVNGLLSVILLGLAIGIYNRFFAAHIASLFVIIFVLVLSILNLFELFDPEVLGSEGVDAAIFGVAGGLIDRIYLFLKIVQVTVAALALFYALLKVSPEFDRVEIKQIARTQRGLHTAVDYHMVARRLAGQGKLASAVLHWQKAAAIEPGSIAYQRNLAKAYLQLGFMERGFDVLNYAKDLPMQESTRSEIKRLLEWAGARITSENVVA
jgi:hypothetical protein